MYQLSLLEKCWVRCSGKTEEVFSSVGLFFSLVCIYVDLIGNGVRQHEAVGLFKGFVSRRAYHEFFGSLPSLTRLWGSFFCVGALTGFFALEVVTFESETGSNRLP